MFGASFVLHLVYDNAESAAIAGHRLHGYATAKVTNERWFHDKESFMGVVCKAFEKFYDEMKIGSSNGKN